MKKLLTYFLLLFIVLFSFWNNTFWYWSFTQTSDPQNSTNAVDWDVVDAIWWNSMVYDIANIIVDIWNLKDYIDANLVTFFKDDWTSLNYTDKNVYLWKNLNVDGKTTTNTITINPWTLNKDVIISEDIKNGSLLQEDLDPNIDYWQDVVWIKSWPNLYYKAGNIAIWDITANEKLEITNWSLKINGAWHWIKFSDGSILKSRPLPSTDNVLTKTNQEIDWIKTFKKGISLPNKDTENIFNFPIDYSSSDTLTWNHQYITANNTVSQYYVTSSGSNSWALFDRNITMNGKPTLKIHINNWKYVEVKLNAIWYNNQIGETPTLLPNTTYYTKVMVKSDLTWDSYGAHIRILTHDKDWNATGEYSLTPNIKSSQDWTIYESTFTTASNVYSSHLEFRIYWHTGTKTLHWNVWFDVNDMVIKPILNTNGEITKVSNIIDNNVNKEEDIKTLVTEKAINDYLWTKVTKIDGECSALKSRILWTSPKIWLCDIWIPSQVTKNWDDTYSWTCSGLNWWNSVSCKTQVCTPNNVTISETVTNTSEQNKIITKPNITWSWTYWSSNNNRYTQEFIVPSWVTQVKISAKLERNEEPCCDRSTFYIYKNGSNIKTYGSYQNRGSTNITYNINVTSWDKLKLRLNKSHDGSVNRWDSYIKDVKFEYKQIVTTTSTITKTIDKNYCSTKWVSIIEIKNIGWVRKYEDWTVAKSCLEYKNWKDTNHIYAGDIWDWTYTINPLSGNINVYCDMTTDWWGRTLVWRWREWWAWNNNWKNINNVYKNIWTSWAFVPAYLSANQINSIINNKNIKDLQDWIRLKRALNVGGTSYQEIKWVMYNHNSGWSWLFDQDVSSNDVTTYINSVNKWNKRTRDTYNWQNDSNRIFTRARSGHNNKKWFAHGQSIYWQNNSTSFLWDYNNNHHSIWYTEVYIRK